ncbi:MAG: riboflavin biosynthesis protein RibF [Candidatus Edwardsbacteria bacterium]|nr:riboflavin biosynthesis protein RibF [Candidatus Edwardsbacteria bacterium]
MLTTKKLKNFGKLHPRAIVAFGVFDGLHRGHQALIRRLVERARRGGRRGANSVALTFDPHPQLALNKNKRPMILTTLSEKEELLAELGVDVMGIIRFSRTTAKLSPADFVRNVLVKKLAAAEVICGEDCGFGRGRAGDLNMLRALGKEHGFAVSSLCLRSYRREKISSTKIREALLAGGLATANRMLGRPYQLSGTVARGCRIGRTLGYRTANMAVKDKSKLIPASGVYAATAAIAGRQYPGMLYIGCRPTFRGGSKRQIEFNAFGAKKNFYGRKIDLKLIRYIRPERTFASAAILKKAIGSDEKTIRKIFLRSAIDIPASM